MATTTSTSFFTQLEARSKEVDSLLCVGLDPHMKELFPDKSDAEMESIDEEHRCDVAFTFCKTIIDLTGTFNDVSYSNKSDFALQLPNFRGRSFGIF